MPRVCWRSVSSKCLFEEVFLAFDMLAGCLSLSCSRLGEKMILWLASQQVVKLTWQCVLTWRSTEPTQAAGINQAIHNNCLWLASNKGSFPLIKQNTQRRRLCGNKLVFLPNYPWLMLLWRLDKPVLCLVKPQPLHTALDVTLILHWGIKSSEHCLFLLLKTGHYGSVRAYLLAADTSFFRRH